MLLHTKDTCRCTKLFSLFMRPPSGHARRARLFHHAQDLARIRGKKRPVCRQWRGTFPRPWLQLPEPSIQRLPCQRRRYITAATAPAVQITNAARGGGDHVLQPGSIQAPAAIAGAQLLQWPVLSVCWEGRSHVPLTPLSSHVQRSSFHFLNTCMLFFCDLDKVTCQRLEI